MGLQDLQNKVYAVFSNRNNDIRELEERYRILIRKLEEAKIKNKELEEKLAKVNELLNYVKL